jgi:hypothetical protein
VGSAARSVFVFSEFVLNKELVGGAMPETDNGGDNGGNKEEGAPSIAFSNR